MLKDKTQNLKPDSQEQQITMRQKRGEINEIPFTNPQDFIQAS
jgi:hypothetical protein